MRRLGHDGGVKEKSLLEGIRVMPQKSRTNAACRCVERHKKNLGRGGDQSLHQSDLQYERRRDDIQTRYHVINTLPNNNRTSTMASKVLSRQPKGIFLVNLHRPTPNQASTTTFKTSLPSASNVRLANSIASPTFANPFTLCVTRPLRSIFKPPDSRSLIPAV